MHSRRSEAFLFKIAYFGFFDPKSGIGVKGVLRVTKLFMQKYQFKMARGILKFFIRFG